MKSIFSFSNYRDFLQYHYDSHKKKVLGYSYARFSQKAGLGSANYLKLVMNGKRNLTVNNIHQFAKALDLAEPEIEYFESLVLLEQATTAGERSYYKRRVLNMRRLRPQLTEYIYSKEFVSQWYHPAILICLYGEQNELQISRISELTGLAEKTIISALEILSANGLIQNLAGIYRLSESHLVFKNLGISKNSQRMYLAEQLKLSEKALKEKYSSGAKFYAHTFSIAEKNFEAYTGLINKLLVDITALSDNEPVEKLLQLNMQLFPVN